MFWENFRRRHARLPSVDMCLKKYAQKLADKISSSYDAIVELSDVKDGEGCTCCFAE